MLISDFFVKLFLHFYSIHEMLKTHFHIATCNWLYISYVQDIEYVNAAYDKIAKLVERGEKAHKQEYDTLKKVKDLLENKKQHIRFSDWDGKDVSVESAVWWQFLMSLFS